MKKGNLALLTVEKEDQVCMWIKNNNIAQNSTLHTNVGQVIEFNQISADHTLTFRFYHQKKIEHFESEDAILLLSGRIRQYGCDYPNETDFDWLLDLLLNKPMNYYSQLAGFFSLVLLNKRDGSLLLLNDHVGSLPFYYCLPEHEASESQNKNMIWVSDHLKHQSVIQRALNPQALFNYFFFHCIPSTETVFVSVSKMDPATELVISAASSVQQNQMYSPTYPNTELPAALLQQQCQQSIDTAVARNVCADDAAFLSGGLDSSTVSGFLCKNQPHARTFSIGFDAKGYDETEYALITAKHFGSNHHVHYLQPSEIVENFVDVAGFFDEPFGNSSAMAAFICAKVAKEHGVKVMLAGDGGDEIFAGNERYAKQKVFELYQQIPNILRSPLELLLKTPLSKLPGFNKAKSYVDQANVPLPDRLDSYNFLNRFSLEQMFCQKFLKSVDVNAPAEAKRRRFNSCPSNHPVEKMMFLDWKFTLADNDLVKVSSMCQKAGIEVRYPLFEKEVVDFSCTVPAELKLPGHQLRDFYKNSFRGFLPDATLSKSKHGFGLPFGVWMKEQPALQQLTESSLNKFKSRGIIRAEFIDQALDIYRSGHASYYGELIWIMVVLELWLQRNETVQ